MAKVKKKTEGYGYKYADLEAVNEMIEQIHGSYFQYTKTDEIDHKCYVWTHRNADDILDHAVEIRGAEVVNATLSNGKQNPAQAAGSAMTYARRYSLYMAYGIACVDDDAESLTIPPDAVKEPVTDQSSGFKSKARAKIVEYCRAHALDIYTISEQYGITKGLSEDVLQAKYDMLVKDHGE